MLQIRASLRGPLAVPHAVVVTLGPVPVPAAVTPLAFAP